MAARPRPATARALRVAARLAPHRPGAPPAERAPKFRKLLWAADHPRARLVAATHNLAPRAARGAGAAQLGAARARRTGAAWQARRGDRRAAVEALAVGRVSACEFAAIACACGAAHRESAWRGVTMLSLGRKNVIGVRR